MKQIIFFAFLILMAPKISFSQEVKKPVYYKYIFDPEADARRDLDSVIRKAKDDHKRVLIIVGGDWNYWARQAYDSLVNNDVCNKYYVLDLINFSPLNKNPEVLTSLECPKDQGYPIFIVLDEKGKKIHHQDTDVFKLNIKSYDMTRMNGFLVSWAKRN